MLHPGAVLIAYVLVVVIGIGFATLLAGQVQDGQTLGGTIDRMFPVTAQCVMVAWLEIEPPAGASGLGDDRAVLYLGRADRIAVFYDADVDTAIRVPANRIVISGC